MHSSMSKTRNEKGDRGLPTSPRGQASYTGGETHAMRILLFCMGPSAAGTLVTPKKSVRGPASSLCYLPEQSTSGLSKGPGESHAYYTGLSITRPGCPTPRVYDVTKELTLKAGSKSEIPSVSAARGWEGQPVCSGDGNLNVLSLTSNGEEMYAGGWKGSYHLGSHERNRRRVQGLSQTSTLLAGKEGLQGRQKPGALAEEEEGQISERFESHTETLRSIQ